MTKILASNRIYIDNSKIKGAGRGVFAKKDISKDDVIEICPIIEVPHDDNDQLNRSSLVTYFLYLGESKDRLALMLGFGSLYNHSYKPNATFSINENGQSVEFIALENIKENSEITFNYKHDSQSTNPLWFEV